MQWSYQNGGPSIFFLQVHLAIICLIIRPQVRLGKDETTAERENRYATTASVMTKFISFTKNHTLPSTWFGQPTY